jgi:tetratricopeptide (TPR) repeat protein
MSGAAAAALPAGAPADVFALGVTLHESLAGSLPFQGDSPIALLFVIANDPPRPLRDARPEVPQDLADLVGRMLVKDPETRPDALSAAQALGAMTGVAVTLPPARVSGEPGTTVDTQQLTAPFESESGRVTQSLDAKAGALIRTGSTEELEVERRANAPSVADPGSALVPVLRSRGGRVAVVLAGLVIAIATALSIILRRGADTPDVHAVALNNEGLDSLRSGNLVAAQARFGSALAISRNYPEAKLNLAIVLQRSDRADSAARVFGEVLTEANRPDLQAGAHYGLGEIDLDAEAWPSAVGHLSEANRLDSTRVEFANNLGFALIQAGRTDDALAHLQSAARRFPGEAALHKNLALAWLKAGQIDSARSAVDQALRLRPDYAPAIQLRTEIQSAVNGAPAH